MAKKQSIIEKFTDTMKGLADSASEALKAEEPPHVEETTATYMPFAAEGLVSDPTLPIAVRPVRKRRATKATGDRGAGRRARKSSSRSEGRTAARKAPRKKADGRPSRARSKSAASARKTGRKTTKRGGRKAARKKSR